MDKIRIRIRIWNRDVGGLVYDNQMNAPDDAGPTTEIGGAHSPFIAGWSMDLDTVVAYAMGSETVLNVAATPVKARRRGLTAREREVAVPLAGGLTNEAIARDLTVVVKTVEKHVTSLLSKLGFDSRAQVAAWAVAQKLAPPPVDPAE